MLRLLSQIRIPVNSADLGQTPVARQQPTVYVKLRPSAALCCNSIPQLFGCQPRALCQRGEFEPGHAWMGIVEPQGRGGKTAVGSRDDVIAPDDLGKPHDPFGDQFRVFHQVGGVADHAGDEDLSGGELDPLEDMVFVFMARVRRLERISAGVDLQHDINDVLQVHFVDARTDID